MRSRILLPTLCVGLAIAFFIPPASAQYTINTVAGGGPNNLPAQQVGVGSPVSVALDKNGNLYISDAYSSQVFEIANGTACTTCILTLVAGNGTTGYSGDGGAATSAALSEPEGIFVDGSGNIFIADSGNNVIREVQASTGNISTVAGNFTLGAGYSGDGSSATSAQLNDPFGVYVDGNGNIFIADTDNNVIREVSASSGNISTVAGNFNAGSGYSGDNGPAISAQLAAPQGVYLDAAGNIFIADTLNSVIRAVNPGTASVAIAGATIPAGDIATVAGANYNTKSGTACQFTTDINNTALSAFLCEPTGVFVDGSGNIYIADTDNYAIREVNASGIISTVAGTLGSFGYAGNGAAATAALLNYPSGLTVDSSGDIFIADTANFVVREVTGGNIQPFAGNNTRAFSGDGGPATSAALDAPGGVFVDTAGNVYIADTNSSAIRVFNPGTQAVTIAGVTIAPGDIATVAGDGRFCAVPIPGGCGDGAAATSAQLNFPSGVFVDGSGNIYIADTGLIESENSVIRVVNGGTSAVTVAGIAIPPGFIQTVVGTLGTAGFAGDGGAPTSAELFNPQGVTLDPAGNVFIADTENSAIRVVNTGTAALTIGAVTIAPGTINTVAGTPPTACTDPSSGCGDNGPANAAALNFPTGISVDAGDDIYIADSSNSAVRVVNASAANPLTIAGTTIAPSSILTVAGTMGRDGYTGDNGPPSAALLNTPYGLFLDSLGNIFIADSENSAVREIVAVDGTIETIAGNDSGTPGFSGDGEPSTSASLNVPLGVALDSLGNIYVADTENVRVRQLTSTVAVAVVPSTSTVPASFTQQFLANVTGTTNTNVTWQVNGITGGNSTIGTISAEGLYQAPSAALTTNLSITAVSDANGTSSGKATVAVAATEAAAVSVSTTPAGVTLVYVSATQTFAANVTGESNTAVNWFVNNVAGGNATVGTISSSGVYTAPSAPPSPALVLIKAVSQANSAVSASYPLDLANVPSVATPSPQSVGPGGTANFSLALNANTGSPQHPITLSCVQNTMPSGANCSFSPATITPSSSAVSFNLAITVPVGDASFLKPHTTWPAYLAFSPLAGILLLSGNRRKRRAHGLALAMLCFLLLSLIGCGGSSGGGSSSKPVTYNIQIQGTTPAQPTAVVLTTATLTVQ